MPQSRAAMTVARLLDPQPGRARARPVRGAGRQDDPPRRADGGPRARSWRSSATAAAPRRSRAPRSGWGRAASRCAPPTPPPSTSRRPTTACSSTRRARTSARSPAGPTPAGARPPTSPRGSRHPGRDPARRRGRRAPRRHARLLDLHDLAQRERGRRSGVPGRTHRFRGGRPARGGPRLAASSCAPPPPDAAAPRRHGGLLHRPAAEARRFVTEPEVDLGPICPACHEPWLRPTQLPGRYRCVNCLSRFELQLRVPELRRALDDRAHVRHRPVRLQQLRELDAPGRSDDRARGRRPLHPGRRLLAAGRAGRRGARRRRARDPRRRDGRPLRAADHDGAARGRRAGRARPRARAR